MPAGLDNLKHIVVLMMENRSFDHMLGYARSDSWPIEALKGDETNLDSNNGVAQVSNDAGYEGDFTPDPGHAVFDTLTQLYGGANTPVTQDPTMSGFVRSYEGKNLAPQDAHRIMKCFSPEKVPVLTTLAQKFCVCDHWFSSVPGPTFPNRAFIHAATSIGRVDMGFDWGNITTTIYERLAQNKVDAVIYYHDSTMAMTFNGLARNMQDYFGTFDDFLSDCKRNELPAYSFIEPRFANSPGGGGQSSYLASDQHPDHDVGEGEALIQTVFEAIWNNPNPAVRNSTLLVIVYDEHGGLYDHVPPPTTVNPDDKSYIKKPPSMDPSFDFTRLGVRVPAVLVSPYIEAGTIDPTVYDHTSVIATARKLLIPNVANSHLTLRDKNAYTFEKNLTRDIARTDQIDLGVAVQPAEATQAHLDAPINDHLAAHVQSAAFLEQKMLPADQQSGKDPATVLKQINTEGAASAYIQGVAAKVRALPQAGAAGGKP
jgi:phospholipase C